MSSEKLDELEEMYRGRGFDVKRSTGRRKTDALRFGKGGKTGDWVSITMETRTRFSVAFLTDGYTGPAEATEDDVPLEELERVVERYAARIR